jgi:hypothetical protein
LAITARPSKQYHQQRSPPSQILGVFNFSGFFHHIHVSGGFRDGNGLLSEDVFPIIILSCVKISPSFSLGPVSNQPNSILPALWSPLPGKPGKEADESRDPKMAKKSGVEVRIIGSTLSAKGLKVRQVCLEWHCTQRCSGSGGGIFRDKNESVLVFSVLAMGWRGDVMPIALGQVE